MHSLEVMVSIRPQATKKKGLEAASCPEGTKDRGRQNSGLIQEEQQRQALRQEKWCRQAMPSSEEPEGQEIE